MAKWSNKRKAAVAIAGVGTAGVLVYLLWPKGTAGNLLSAQVSSSTVRNPDQSVTVTIEALGVGAVQPYSYRVDWPDGQSSSSAVGNFVRTFPSGAILPTSALVTVMSSDGQSVKVNG